MDLFNSDFQIGVASSNKRSVETVPTFSTTTSKGGMKINELASRLIDVKNGEYIMLVSNFEAVNTAIQTRAQAILDWAEENDAEPEDYPVFWGIAKGYLETDRNGNPIKVPERLTNAQKQQYIDEGKVDDEGKPIPEMVDKYKGSKMSSQNGVAGYGILTGNDSSNWAPLGGNHDNIVIYDVSNDFQEIELDGHTVKVFPLINKRTKDKIVRG